MIKYSLALVFLLLFGAVNAQDTLQVMQYNLLNYGNYYNDCTTTTNNVNTKNGHLRTIIAYVQPDIFTVNELSGTRTYHQLILDQVLNINGITKYRKAVSLSDESDYLVNMLYYNSEKLALYKQDVIRAIVRDIDVYTLYYKAGDLAQTHDTTFLTCIVAHLKAGTTSDDATDRAGMVSSALTYIRTHDLPGNLMFMGDFNLYTNSEQAYTNLTYTYNGIRYFYDPINREGSWNNNSAFADVHTQSTHATSQACFSTGGLDDRFDFIMATRPLLDGMEGAQMLTNTYQALGNDGQHFNKNITDTPQNPYVPGQVIEAMYGMSDHLPILVKIKVDARTGFEELASNITAIRMANPNNGLFQLGISLSEPSVTEVEIYDLFGRKQFEKQYAKDQIFINDQIDIRGLASGYYILMVTDRFGRKNSSKFFLKK